MVVFANIPYLVEGFIALHAVAESHTCCSDVSPLQVIDFIFADFVTTLSDECIQ